MNTFDQEMRKQVLQGDFARTAANSIDHLLLQMRNGKGDPMETVTCLEHHRNCMLLLQDEYEIKPRN